MRASTLIALIACGIASLPRDAQAQATLPPEVPPPSIPVEPPGPTPGPIAEVPAPPADVSGPQWQQKWAEAREKMLAGQFADAAQDFDLLARTARGPIDRALAQNNAALCREWATRDLVFVKRSDLGESSLAAKATDVRTTDELAVLYTTAVFYGIGGGAWLAAQTKPDSAGGFILPALGLAGASVGVVALLDSGRPLHYGVPQSIVTGTYLGLEEGIVWALWNQARTRYDEEWKGGTVATVIFGSATIGALGGGIIGTVNGTTPGRASWVGSTSLWSGVIAGLLGAGLSDVNQDRADDHALLAAAIGLNAGAVAGLVTAKSVSPSIARVRFIDLGGIAGALVFGGLYVAAGSKSDDASSAVSGFFLVTALGTSIGLGTAWLATASMPADRTDAKDSKPATTTSMSPRLIPVRGGGALGVGGQF